VGAKGLLFGGSMIVDLVKRMNKLPGKGKLGVILDVTRGVGGMACNNPTNIKVLDPSLDVAVMGRVGDDDNGRYILSEYKRHKIDTSAVVISKTAPTSFTDVMSDTTDGSRTFFHSYGACAEWGPDDIPWDKIASRFSFVQLGYALLLKTMDADDSKHGTVLAGVLKRLTEMGLRTCIDVVTEDSDRFRHIVTPSLKHVDDLIINEVEASSITGESVRDSGGKLLVKGLLAAAKKLLDSGVRKTVVLHAPEGSVALTSDGGKFTQPSHDIDVKEIVSSVGAGDAFASGVVYGLNKSMPMPETLKLATAMAAMNLFDPTTTGGARPLKEVLAFSKKRAYRKGIFDV
jgi:sugar/nucleoside kinase (ribokinase family)